MEYAYGIQEPYSYLLHKKVDAQLYFYYLMSTVLPLSIFMKWRI